MPGPGRFSFSMNRPLIQIVELAFAVERNMRTHLFKVTWRHCFGCFCGDQNCLFLWEVRPSPSVTVATKTDFSSRPNCVFFFYRCFLCVNPTRALAQRCNKREFNLKFNLSVVLQKHTQLTLILVIGLQGGCRVKVFDCWSLTF